MEGKITALGGTDFVRPFAAIGLDTFAVEKSAEQIRQSAEKIIEGKFALVVVAEDVAETADEVFAEYSSDAVPAILVMPFTTESKGYAMQSLGEAVKLATGVNILQES